MTFLLGLFLGISIGYCICLPTRRIRHVFIGSTHEQDQAAIADEMRRRFEQLTADLDRPDDPWSST